MKTNKIAFVIDGYYGLVLYKDIKRKYGKVINFEGLVNIACEALGKKLDEKCISPANLRHYYMGTSRTKNDSERNEYEDALKLSRFGARGRPLQNGKEKEIDTMLYSDIKDEANAEAFDYLILLAGDLDHITLVQDLKAMGIKTVLLYGEILTKGVKTTGCSYELKSACFDAVDLYALLENDEIFSSIKHEYSMSDYMKGVDSSERASSFPEKYSLPELSGCRSFEKNFLSLDKSKYDTDLLGKVISSVRQVIDEKEKQEGRKLAFALQSQVGIQLKRIGVTLPVPLGNFLGMYPEVFKTGAHPYTNALTVSVR